MSNMLNKELIKKDFYEAVNGEWLKTAKIPEDRPTVGGFNDLVIKTEEMLIKEFNEMDTKNLDDKMMVEFIKFYNMTKDMDKREKEGVKGLKPYVEKLKALKDFSDFSGIINEWKLKGFSLPFNISVESDMMEATKHALYLDIPSIILPDKTYYEDTHPKKAVLLEKYKEMLLKILDLYGMESEYAKNIIKDTFEFDKLIYPNTKTSVELADYTKIYNPKDLGEVEKYTDKISFTKIFNDLFGFEPKKVIVTQPNFFEKYSEIMKDENFGLMKSWLIVKLILGNTSILTDEMRIEGGAYSRFLTGVEKAKNIEKYSYYFATGIYDDVISIYYGNKYFGEKAKKDVHDMVVSMLEVYKNRLAKNDWLNEKTSKNAIKKLSTFEILVGYPDKYDEVYKELIVDESKTFFENVIKFSEILNKNHFADLAKPVDRTKWHMPSNMVNAYYSPTGNLICFPAAILQAPFYSLSQTKSENYGGIGAVIGHEISHAFDNNGAKFDEKGNLNDWWTKEDFEIFDNKAKAMIDQFDGIPFGNSKVNGELTVAENIADAGGLSCSLEALKNTGEVNLEEFFINFAKIWCMKAKEEYTDLLLSVDVHAPAKLRANIQPRNLKEFYEAFDIKEEDEMYLSPEKRVNIW